MGECSRMGDGSALNGVKMDPTCQRVNGFTQDLDHIVEECGLGECNIRLRSMFDEVLIAFLSERCKAKCFRPVPALCGNGRGVDLFKLFLLVRNIGGYDVVCRKNMWGFIAVQCGLGFGSIAAMKLVYVKYLSDFDKWLWNVYGEDNLEDQERNIVRKLDLLSEELEGRFRGSSLNEGEEIKIENALERLKYEKCGKVIELDNGESEEHWLVDGQVEEIHVNAKHCIDDGDGELLTENYNDLVSLGKRVEKFTNEVHDDPMQQYDDKNGKCSQEDGDIVLSAKTVLEKIIHKVYKVSDSYIDNAKDVNCDCAHDDDNIVASSENVIEKILDSRKRKRETFSLLGMLNWIKHVAKHSDSPSIGQIPEFSKWKDHGTDKLWIQALLARESCLIKQNTNLNVEESPLQKKLRMHPSMYEENDLNGQLTEKLRSSRRISSEKLPQLSLSSNSCSASQTKIVNCQKIEPVNSTKQPAPESIEVLETDKKNDLSMDESPHAHVSIGPLFQAEVPEWTGVVSDGDSKWLGTRTWSPEDDQCKAMMNELLPIGKGRQNSCDCPFPDSVECIRFHIAEKRLKLKQELGSIFYRWRFDRMGEEVSLSWTAEEEHKFKDMVSLTDASGNKFWNDASKFFRTKTREMLVSYYFNVYLVQRRSYQNRVTPKDIDSDDDEKQVGSVGDLFGHKALKAPGFGLLACIQNKECTDLE